MGCRMSHLEFHIHYKTTSHELSSGTFTDFLLFLFGFCFEYVLIFVLQCFKRSKDFAMSETEMGHLNYHQFLHIFLFIIFLYLCVFVFLCICIFTFIIFKIFRFGSGRDREGAEMTSL